MKKSLQITVLLLFSMNLFYAQVALNRTPQESSDEPEWGKGLYSEDPNLLEIQESYDLFFRENIFEKSYATQYYKELNRTYSAYIEEDGSIDFEAYNKQYSKPSLIKENSRSVQRNGLSNNADWSDIGIEHNHNSNGDIISRNVNVMAVAQSKSNPNIMYAGTESAGVWKSTDKAKNWMSITHNVPITAVRSVAIHPTNSNIVLISGAMGVFRTTNGGKSWVQTKLNVNSIEDISFMNDGNTVFATRYSKTAVGGGFYRSKDGGVHWEIISTKIHFDVKQHLTRHHIIYAARRDTENKRVEIIRSIDKGDTWSVIDNGWYMPEKPIAGERDYRSGSGARIALTKAKPNNVYVFVMGSTKQGDYGQVGVFVSNNAGNSWSNIFNREGGPYNNAQKLDIEPPVLKDPSGPPYVAGYESLYWQGYYDQDIAVSQIDANRIFVGGTVPYELDLSGNLIKQIDTGHADQQEFIMDVEDPNIMWAATDGGLVKYNLTTGTKVITQKGIRGRNMWGFSQMWNHDIWAGGSYHNGNSASRPEYGMHNGKNLGGTESTTGNLNPILEIGYFRDMARNFATIPKNITEGSQRLYTIGALPNLNPMIQSNRVIEYHPNYYNVLYDGSGTILWKSEDEGRSFEEIKDFNENVDQVVLSRANTDYIYVLTRQKLYRSTDGGGSFKEMVNPRTRYNGGIELSGTDPNKLWHYTNRSLNESVDGGKTWRKISIPSNVGIKTVVHQLGTEGTLYLAYDSKIYVRELGNTWEEYTTNMPTSFSTRTMEIFYSKGLIRHAGGKGVWSSPLVVDSQPLAMPMVGGRIHEINKEIQFESYSVVKHEGTKWEWSFPGASFVSSTTVRNPQVKYGNPGSYDVTLKITDVNGKTSIRTIEEMIIIDKIHNIENTILEDSYVRHGALGNANYSSEETFSFRDLGKSSKWSRYPYLKIDISNININGLSSNSLIVLDLKTANIIDAERSIGVQEVSNDWNEKTITGNNYPESIGEVIYSDNTVYNTDRIKIDITDLVKNVKNRGNDELSIALWSQDISYQLFYSKEASDSKIPVIQILGDYVTKLEGNVKLECSNIELQDFNYNHGQVVNEIAGKVRITNEGDESYKLLSTELFSALGLSYSLSELVIPSKTTVEVDLKVNGVAEEGNTEIVLSLNDNTCNYGKVKVLSANYEGREIIGDSYIRSGTFSNNNYGNESELFVKQDSNSKYYREALLKLNIKDIDDAAGKVQLIMPIKSKVGAFDVGLYEVSSSWLEYSVNYSKRPSLVSDKIYDTQQVTSSVNELVFDITELVSEYKNKGLTELSIVLRGLTNSSKNYVSFYSRENAVDLQPSLDVKLKGNAKLECNSIELRDFNYNQGQVVDEIAGKVRITNEGDESFELLSTELFKALGLTYAIEEVTIEPKTTINVDLKVNGTAEEGNAEILLSLNDSTCNYGNIEVLFSNNEGEDIIGDSYIRGGTFSNNNYGNESELFVKQDSNSKYYREALLKLNIKDIDDAAGKVQLIMPIKSKVGMFDVGLYEVSSSWLEYSVNYSKKPSLASNKIYDTQQVTSSVNELVFDITELISESKKKGLTELSIVLRGLTNSSRNYVSFYSRENAEELQPSLDYKSLEGIYNLKNVKTSKYISIKNGDEKEGGTIVQYSTPQKWEVKKVGARYQVINVETGLALSKRGNKILELKESNSSDTNQLMEIINNETYNAVSFLIGNKSIEVAGGLGYEGRQISWFNYVENKTHKLFELETVTQSSSRNTISNLVETEEIIMNLYPTLVDGSFTLDTNAKGTFEVRIYDMMGRLRAKELLVNKNKSSYGTTKLDLSKMSNSLESGKHYIVNIVNNGLRKIFRIFKK